MSNVPETVDVTLSDEEALTLTKCIVQIPYELAPEPLRSLGRKMKDAAAEARQANTRTLTVAVDPKEAYAAALALYGAPANTPLVGEVASAILGAIKEQAFDGHIPA